MVNYLEFIAANAALNISSTLSFLYSFRLEIV